MLWLIKLAITLLAFPAGKAADIISSLNFNAYGLHEGNKAFQDDSRELHLGKAIAVSAALEAGLLVVFFFVDQWVAVAGSLLVGGFTFGRAVMNWRKRREKRQEQNKVLDGRFWYGTPFATDIKTGRSYYPLFPWLYSEKADMSEAVVEVNLKLEDLRTHRNFPA